MKKLIVLIFICQVSLANGATKAELEQQVEALNQRVSFLEETVKKLLDREPTKPPGKPEATQLASKTTVTLGGRARLDLIANSASVGGAGGRNRSDTLFFPGTIPTTRDGERRQYSNSTRGSRLWINASTPTPAGDIGAFLELDFASLDRAGNERVSNSHDARLRHAYVTYQNFTLGQTTTTFQNASSFPEVNEGPVGIVIARQPMVRYSRQFDNIKLSLAAEQPETTVTAADGSRLVFDDDQFPDLIGRLDWRQPNWQLSVATLLRQIRMDDIVKKETTGAGVSFAGKVFLKNANNLRFGVTHGKGVGRYVSYNGFNDGVLDQNNDFTALPVTAAYLGYQHWWSKTWRSNIVAGYASADVDRQDYLVGTINDRYLSSQINLLWSPIPKTTFGLEWIHGTRELLDGRAYHLNRIQLSALYNFRFEH